MGLLHCRVGCAYYEDEPCIDCRMCLATTQEEVGSASKKIKEYLKDASLEGKAPPGNSRAQEAVKEITRQLLNES